MKHWVRLNGFGRCKPLINMVGTTGFEPATSSVSRKRSNQLSYAPANHFKLVYQDRGNLESRRIAPQVNAVPSFTKAEHIFA